MPKHTIAEVLDRFGAGYLKHHYVGNDQKRLITDILNCRTPALGGHAKKCNNCGQIKVFHNSCGNRGAPDAKDSKKKNGYWKGLTTYCQ